MNADWKAGDKALRVEDVVTREPQKWHKPNGSLKKGVIYLVDEVIAVPCNDGSTDICLVIAGFQNIWLPIGIEHGWLASRFRKIVPACDRAKQSDSLEIHQGFWDKRPDLK